VHDNPCRLWIVISYKYGSLDSCSASNKTGSEDKATYQSKYKNENMISSGWNYRNVDDLITDNVVTEKYWDKHIITSNNKGEDYVCKIDLNAFRIP